MKELNNTIDNGRGEVRMRQRGRQKPTIWMTQRSTISLHCACKYALYYRGTCSPLRFWRPSCNISKLQILDVNQGFGVATAAAARGEELNGMGKTLPVF